MSENDPKSVASILQRGALGELISAAGARRALTEEVRGRLPAAEAAELTAAERTADGTLVLVMSTAAWAARARYLGDYLGELRLQVRVAPRGRSR